MEQVTACLTRYSEAVRVLKWLKERDHLAEVTARELGEIAYEYAVETEHPFVIKEFNRLAESEARWLKHTLASYDKPIPSRPQPTPKDYGEADFTSARKKCIELAELAEAVQLKHNRQSQVFAAHHPGEVPLPKRTAPKTNAALVEACLALATQILASRTVATGAIESLADRFYDEAIFHAEYIAGQSRDPQILTRAVDYLREVHAIPPFGTDISWLQYSLSCLVELAVPNTSLTSETKTFLADVQEGLRLLCNR